MSVYLSVSYLLKHFRDLLLVISKQWKNQHLPKRRIEKVIRKTQTLISKKIIVTSFRNF